MADDPTRSSRFTYVLDWPRPEAENADAVRRFWLREGAFAEEAAAAARVKQLLMHALTSTGEVAGACTTVATRSPRLGQPMYYWRAFIGKAWRSTPLVMSLLKRSCAYLEEHARTHDFPCVGILLELENARFRDKGRLAVWGHPHFAYIGRSQRGFDLRVLYFRGARLKPAAPG